MVALDRAVLVETEEEEFGLEETSALSQPADTPDSSGRDLDAVVPDTETFTVLDASGRVVARLPASGDVGTRARSIRLISEASRLYDLASFAARNFRAPGPRAAAGEESWDDGSFPTSPRRWSRAEMDAAVRAMLDSYAETCASLVREIESGDPPDPYAGPNSLS